MADSYERLGLEIHLKTTDTFKQLQGLLDKLSSVQQALGKLNTQNATKGLDKDVPVLTAKMKALITSFSELDISTEKGFNKAAKAIAGLMKEFNVNTGLDKFSKDLRKTEQSMDAHVLAYRNMQQKIADEEKKTWAQRNKETGVAAGGNKSSEVEKAYQQKFRQDKEAVKEELAIARQKADMYAQDAKLKEQQVNKLATLQKKEEAIVAAKEKADKRELDALLRKIDAEKKADAAEAQRIGRAQSRANDLNQQLAWNQQAGTQGYKYKSYGNGFVRNSVDLSTTGSYTADKFVPQNANAFNAAHAAALKYNNALREVGKTSNLLTLSLGGMTQRLAEFYSIREVMFAVSGQVREAVAGVLDLNQAIHDIIAISGGGREQLGSISDSIMEIAKSSRYTAKEVGELMQILAQAGVAASALPEVAKQVGIFATATASDPALAADVVTTGMNVFTLKAKDTTRITNAMTAALNMSKLSTDGLATAFNYLAPQAAQLGYSLEQTLGIVAQMAQSGVKPSTIGTGVSQMLKEFSAPKARLKKMLDYYKIDPKEINPTIHSFDEIVDRLQHTEKGAVRVEHLFSALETRVGRSVVTAVTQGAAAFKYMTDSVTGTQAATEAYEKSMEGARARINVLKQEFLQLAVNIGQAIGPVLGGLTELITNIFRGMNTEAGKFITLLVGTGGVVYAISQCAKAVEVLKVAFRALTAPTALESLALLMPALTNPITLVVGGIAALAGVFYLLGNSTKDADQELNNLKESMKATAELGAVINQVTRDNYGVMKQVEQAEEEGAAGTAKLNELKKKEIVLRDDTRGAMLRFVLAHPEYEKKLDLEKTKIGGLIGLLREYNSLKAGDNKKAIGIYNSWVDYEERYSNRKKELDAKQVKLKTNKNSLGSSTALSSQEMFEYAELDKNIAKAKKIQGEALKFVDTTHAKQQMSNKRKLDFMSDEEIAASQKTKEPAADILSKKTGASRAAKEAAATHSREENLEIATTQLKKEKDQVVAATAKSKLEEMKENLQTDSDLITYREEAHQALLEEQIAKRNAVEEEIEQKRQSALKDSKTKKLSAEEITAYEEELGRLRIAKLVQISDEYNKKSNEIDQTYVKVKPSDTVEKQADRALKTTTQRITLEKELASSVEEVLKLEQEQRVAELDSYQVKEKDIRREYEHLKKQREELTNLEARNQWDKTNLGQLEMAEDKHREILLLIQQKQRELEKNKDTSPMGQLKKGATESWNSYQKSSGEWASLGSSVATQGLDGITNSVSKMVTALGEGGNAWKTFRTSLGEVMKGIVEELQRFIIKMLVVYAIEQLIGLFKPGTSSTQGWASRTASSGNYSLGSYSLVAPKFADGGEVKGVFSGFVPYTLGTRGKDSVPAWLMPGEVVINEDAVNKYGADYFLKHNAKRFANGGLASGASPTAAGDAAGKDGKEATLQIINVVDPNSIPRTTDEQIINVISMDAAKNGTTIKTIKAKLMNK